MTTSTDDKRLPLIVDRGDAVTLASDLRATDDIENITRKGIMLLVQAVLEMDEALKAQLPPIGERGACHDAAERDEGCFRALKAERELAEVIERIADLKSGVEEANQRWLAARSAKTPPLDPTPAMIEAGAQRLVRWETGKEKWPDAWSKIDVRAARNDAERCWRSMWLEAEAAAQPTEEAQTQEWDGVDRRKDNWTLLLKDTAHRIGKQFRARAKHRNSPYTFFRLVHGDDDYYYGFYSKEGGLVLSSCVGDIEDFGEEVRSDGPEGEHK